MIMKMKNVDSLKNINLDNILDIMFEPNKNRYSVIQYNGSRKEITKSDFHFLLSFFA